MTIQRASCSVILVAVLASCSERDATIGTGAALTTTPCDRCDHSVSASRGCPQGQTRTCAERTDNTCGWSDSCVSPCAGKSCGDTCSDGSATAVVKYCDPAGTCGVNFPVCR